MGWGEDFGLFLPLTPPGLGGTGWITAERKASSAISSLGAGREVREGKTGGGKGDSDDGMEKVLATAWMENGQLLGEGERALLASQGGSLALFPLLIIYPLPCWEK